MKLQNMSVPMTADEVETYVETILRAVAKGYVDHQREVGVKNSDCSGQAHPDSRTIRRGSIRCL